MGPRPGFSPQEENTESLPLHDFEPGLRDPQSLVLTATLSRPSISRTLREMGTPFSPFGFKRITLSFSSTIFTESVIPSFCLASAGTTILFFLSSFATSVKAIHPFSPYYTVVFFPLYKLEGFFNFE